MINKLYTYGCSFSSDWWIDEEQTYTALVSKQLGCDYIRRAEPAICNNEIYHRLTKDFELFNEGDFIIYQFTALDRGGYWVNNDSLYITTSLLTEDVDMNTLVLNEWGVGREKYEISDSDLIKLLDYNNVWERHSLFYKYNIVHNTLEFLKEKYNVNYVMLFLDNYFQKFCTNNYIEFPIETNPKSVSIRDWVVMNNLTIADSNPIRPKWDTHPNEKAQYHIASKILKFIKNECK